jgi:hypothetical protein
MYMQQVLSVTKLVLLLLLALTVSLCTSSIVFAQTEGETDTTDTLTTVLPYENIVCTEGFSIDNIYILATGESRTVRRGDTVTYEVAITNGNDRDVFVEKLYATTYFLNESGSPQYSIDTRLVAENIKIGARNVLSLTDVWEVPRNLANGSHVTEYSLVPHGSGIAALATATPASDVVLAGTPATLVADSITVNTVSASDLDTTNLTPGNTIILSAQIANPESVEKEIPVTWSVYEGYEVELDALVEYDVEFVTVPANGSVSAPFEFVIPRARNYQFIVEADDDLALSQLNYNLSVGEPEPAILAAGMYQYKSETGPAGELFSCVANPSDGTAGLTVVTPDGTMLVNHSIAATGSAVPHRLSIPEATPELYLGLSVARDGQVLSFGEIVYENEFYEEATVADDTNNQLMPYLLMTGIAVFLILIIIAAVLYRRNQKETPDINSMNK